MSYAVCPHRSVANPPLPCLSLLECLLFARCLSTTSCWEPSVQPSASQCLPCAPPLPQTCAASGAYPPASPTNFAEGTNEMELMKPSNGVCAARCAERGCWLRVRPGRDARLRRASRRRICSLNSMRLKASAGGRCICTIPTPHCRGAFTGRLPPTRPLCFRRLSHHHVQLNHCWRRELV